MTQEIPTRAALQSVSEDLCSSTGGPLAGHGRSPESLWLTEAVKYQECLWGAAAQVVEN